MTFWLGGGGEGTSLPGPREPGTSLVVSGVVSAAVAIHLGLFFRDRVVAGVMGSGALNTLGDGHASAFCVAEGLAAVVLCYRFSIKCFCGGYLLEIYKHRGHWFAPVGHSSGANGR